MDEVRLDYIAILTRDSNSGLQRIWLNLIMIISKKSELDGHGHT